MNKIDLEVKIESLRTMILDSQQQTSNYTGQLTEIEKQLKDLGKIALPPIMFDDIYEAIEKGVGEFDWSDTNNYEIEYGIDYDGRVNCESFDLENSRGLVEMIVKEVSKLFTEMNAPEDEPTAEEFLNTTEDDNHPVEKLQG